MPYRPVEDLLPVSRPTNRQSYKGPLSQITFEQKHSVTTLV